MGEVEKTQAQRMNEAAAEMQAMQVIRYSFLSSNENTEQYRSNINKSHSKSCQTSSQRHSAPYMISHCRHKTIRQQKRRASCRNCTAIFSRNSRQKIDFYFTTFLLTVSTIYRAICHIIRTWTVSTKRRYNPGTNKIAHKRISGRTSADLKLYSQRKYKSFGRLKQNKKKKH